MIGKLFVTAAVGVALMAAPAYAAPKGSSGPPGQEKKAELASACKGYTSALLKGACANDKGDNGLGLGHCKGKGEGHNKARGRGHDRDHDCPVSA